MLDRWTFPDVGGAQEQHVKWVRQRLNKLLKISSRNGIKFRNQLPCMQPASTSADRVASLMGCQYLVTPKADGTRYFIYCCFMAGHPLAIAINRSYALTLLECDLPPNMFNGTVIDCELVSPETLLAFDLLEVQGFSLRTKTYAYRHQQLQRLCPLDFGGIKMTVKPSWPFDECAMQQLGMVTFPTDGYIIQSVREKVVVGRSKMTYRVKDRETIDLLFIDLKPYLFSAGTRSDADGLITVAEPPPHDGVWECYCDYIDAGKIHCVPHHLRSDKIEPNDVTVVSALRRLLPARPRSLEIVSPPYAPSSPGYAPMSPLYTPSSPGYTPSSPPYAPSSPPYAPYTLPPSPDYGPPQSADRPSEGPIEDLQTRSYSLPPSPDYAPPS